MKKLRLMLLKRRARSAYQNYIKVLESLDCGRYMALSISSSCRYYAEKFNNTMDKICAIDPNAPKDFRIEMEK